MNLPNKLSMARLAMIPLILAGLLAPGLDAGNHQLAAWCYLAAFVLVVAATLTDWLDGKIARSRNLITSLGKLLDPLADKVLVAAVMIALVELHIIWGWMVVVILAREFIVTGLRGLAALEGRAMAADIWGKYKTALQLATILIALLLMTVREFMRTSGGWNESAWNPATEWTIHGLMAATTLLTILSGWVYLSKNRGLLRE
jgi:CDP-diacylglycerol--glycerol-3-phosphate 3-phosphatidyltransferase